MAEDTVKDRVYTPWSAPRGTGVYGNTSSPQESNTGPFSEKSKYATRSGEEDAAGYIDVEKDAQDEVPDHNEEILAPLAKHYGLDPKEVHLALSYAAASKELAQRTLDATPEEVTRLKGMKRLASLMLDLWQRREVFKGVKAPLVDERQCDLAGQLSGTLQHLRNLEKTLFGKPRTPIDGLVTMANTSRVHYRSENPESKPETPPTSRRVDRNHPHLAA